MTQTSLSFQWTLGTVAISIAALTIVAVLGFIAWQRSGFRRQIMWLELLRTSMVAFAVLLLNQPESVEQFLPEQQPTVVVLGDQSLSMSTRDVGLSDSTTTGNLQSREESISGLMQAEAWKQVSDEDEGCCNSVWFGRAPQSKRLACSTKSKLARTIRTCGLS